jgi:hypothetical protein
MVWCFCGCLVVVLRSRLQSRKEVVIGSQSKWKARLASRLSHVHLESLIGQARDFRKRPQ